MPDQERRTYTGEAFGQEEPLTTRIKGLLHQYPQGVGILKELLQNADDARAKTVVFTVDWRDHRGEAGNLPDDRMRELLGPALLAYNDARFSDEDFTHVRRIGDSAKREDVTRTGRFGIGFNSVYHVTDCPGFLSRNRLVFFDPHDAFVSQGGTHGHSFRFGADTPDDLWKDCPLLARVYAAGDPCGTLRLDPKDGYGATVFRLPFRDDAQATRSEIRPGQTFTCAHMEEIIQRFTAVGAELLLFLKNVRTLEIQEIGWDDSSNTARPRVVVCTQNPSDVDTAWNDIQEFWKLDPADQRQLCGNGGRNLPVRSYRHHLVTATFQYDTDGNVSAAELDTEWRVVSGIASDSDGKMANLMSELAQMPNGAIKAVPSGGVAALIRRSESLTEGGQTIRVDSPLGRPVDGRVYCTLPLDTPSGLPVHVNGFFDLDSARTGLTVEGNMTGADRKRGEWNRAVARFVIAPLYTRLLEDLRGDLVGPGGENIELYYEHFPTTTGKVPALSDLPPAVRELVKGKEVIRIYAPDPSKGVWAKPGNVKILPANHPDLKQPLAEIGYRIPDPHPSDAIYKYLGFEAITVSNVRNALVQYGPRVTGIPMNEAPQACLQRREWVLALLRFCMTDPNQPGVAGLPLAIRADGKLATFRAAGADLKDPTTCVWFPSEDTLAIFATRPDWFLDRSVLEEVQELNKIVNGLPRLSAESVARFLHLALPPLPKNDPWSGWNPDGEKLPEKNWLTKVYLYFARQKLTETGVKALKSQRIIPASDGQLYRPGTMATPLLADPKMGQGLRDLLTRCSICFVTAPDPLQSAIKEFAQAHPGFIWWATPEDVLDSMISVFESEQPALKRQEREALLDFFGRISPEDFTEKRKLALCSLPLFPVAGLEEPITLTDTGKVYVPGGYSPPRCAAGNIRVLDTGQNSRWSRLFSDLGVPVLSRQRLLEDVLIPNYETLKAADQVEALAWIRDNLAAAETESGNANELRRLIRGSHLIRGTDGKLHTVATVYNPKNEVTRDILRDSVPYPDFGRSYATASDRWTRFFSDLGWQKWPVAQDIAAYVVQLSERAKLDGASAVSDQCRRIFDFLREEWGRYGNESVRVNGQTTTLASLLKQCKWIPTVQDADSLRRYYGARTPENRLYRPSEVTFIQNVNLIASQLPLFNLQFQPSREMQDSLGFLRPESSAFRDLVLHHLETLIADGPPAPDTPAFKAYVTGLGTIYRYFDQYQSAFPDQAVVLSRRFAELPCLWNGERLLIPARTFRHSGECFGGRRSQFAPNEPYVTAAWQLLGQRESPEIPDFIEVLRELEDECRKNEPLAEQDRVIAREILQSLWNRIRNDAAQKALVRKGIRLLTADGLMALADRVLIPDATWRVKQVDQSVIHLLDSDVPQELAVAVGCVSLATGVDEELETMPVPGGTRRMRDIAERIQRTCRSAEFWHGLRRLVNHEGVSSLPPSTRRELQNLNIVPVDNIRTRLVLDRAGKRVIIARGVEAPALYDGIAHKLYLKEVQEERDAEVPVAEQLNEGIFEGALSDRTLLCRILTTEPDRISTVLSGNRVTVLPEDQEEINGHTTPEPKMVTVGPNLFPELDPDLEPVMESVGTDNTEARTAQERGDGAITHPSYSTTQTTQTEPHVGALDSGGDADRGEKHEDEAPESEERSASESENSGDDTRAYTGDAGSSVPASREPQPVTQNPGTGQSIGAKTSAPSTPRSLWRAAGSATGLTSSVTTPRTPSQSPHRPHDVGENAESAPRDTTDQVPTPLPSSHTSFTGMVRPPTPTRPVDVNDLHRRFPNAEITPQSPTVEATTDGGMSDFSPRSRRPASNGSVPQQTRGTVLLRANSFVSGVLILDSPQPVALFPEQERLDPCRDSGNTFWFPLRLQGDDAALLHLAVDYEKDVAFCPVPEEKEWLILWLQENQLQPGCYMTLERLESGEYRLGYVDEPQTLYNVPLLEMDADTGLPRVSSIPSLTLPCPVNRRLFLADRRFADDDALLVLLRLTQSAPDLLSAIIQLLESSTGPITMDDLYAMNYAVRPVAWSYFEQVINDNTGDGLPFIQEASGITLRPADEVVRIAPPLQNRSQRQEYARGNSLQQFEEILREQILAPWPSDRPQEEIVSIVVGQIRKMFAM